MKQNCMKQQQVKIIAPNLKSLMSMLIFGLVLSFTVAQAQTTFQKFKPVFQAVPLTVEITQPTVSDEPLGLGGGVLPFPHLIHNQEVALEAKTNRVVKNASYQWQVSTSGPFSRIIASGSGFVQHHTPIIKWTPYDNGYVGGDYNLTVVVIEADGTRTSSEPQLIRIIPAPN